MVVLIQADVRGLLQILSFLLFVALHYFCLPRFDSDLMDYYGSLLLVYSGLDPIFPHFTIRTCCLEPSCIRPLSITISRRSTQVLELKS